MNQSKASYNDVMSHALSTSLSRCTKTSAFIVKKHKNQAYFHSGKFLGVVLWQCQTLFLQGSIQKRIFILLGFTLRRKSFPLSLAYDVGSKLRWKSNQSLACCRHDFGKKRFSSHHSFPYLFYPNERIIVTAVFKLKHKTMKKKVRL